MPQKNREVRRKLLSELKNAIFPSDEDDGIEHVDMGYTEFLEKLDELANLGDTHEGVIPGR